MAQQAKKFRSKWFRVAVEGATTDGRQIERSWIEDAAATYNPSKYGARVWLEHYRGVLPDGPFKAYGDVLAVKAEEIELDGQKRLALFAQIEPTDELIAMNKAKQKIYTSAEIHPKFSDSGRAYLSGLAVTDTPASLGTEALKFSAQNPAASPFAGRKTDPASLFSEAVEVELEFEELDDKPGIGAALFTKVQALLKRNQSATDTEFAHIAQAVEDIAEHVKDLPEQYAQGEQRVTELGDQLKTLQSDLADLKAQLGKTADHSQQQRPSVTGGNGQQLADF